MKNFRFKKGTLKEKHTDSNGWVFNFRFKKNLGFFKLRTPIMKEVTYSKGPAVRYQKHRVFGIGMIDSDNEFSGLAFFDYHIRILIFLIILLGTTYASLSVLTGLLFASFFYLLILFLSSEDDDKLLCQCKLMFETDP